MTTLLRIIGLRGDDIREALPLSLAYLQVMAALYVLKPVRNALFLDRFGAAGLPIVMLAVAVLGAATAAAYGALSQRASLERLVSGMFLIVIGCLGVFRIVLPLGTDAANYAFYMWVAVYGLVATSLIWQVANTRFNPREARRIFGIIGAAGIVGASMGGVLTAGITDFIGTDNLVLVAAALVGGAYRCVTMGMRGLHHEAARDQEASEGNIFGALKASPLLSWMAVMGALIGVVAVIVDIQFNHFVELAMPTRDEKVAFFGRFLAYFNAVAILIQLLLTTRVLSVVGVGPALLMLPASIGLGTTGLLLVPGLLSASLLKIADGALRHSIHKSAFEVLFIPVPERTRKRAKLFLDATVDSAATGVGALLVLFLIEQVGLSYLQLSWFAYGLIGAWLATVWRIRRAYVETLAAALRRRKLDTSVLTSSIAEAGALEVLLSALRDGTNVRRMTFALEALASVSDPRVIAVVKPLLQHPAARVRVLAARTLAAQPQDPDLRQQAEPLLTDPDDAVRVAAARLLAAHDPEGTRATLSALLRRESSDVRSAALGAVAADGDNAELSLVGPALIARSLQAPDPEAPSDGARACARMHVATLLGRRPYPPNAEFWERLRDDPSERVVIATIDAAGRNGDPVHLPWLFRLLEDRRYRMDARLALARFGPPVLGSITRLMDDPDAPPRTRRVLPRIVARIDSPDSVSLLLERAARADWADRRRLLDALSKLRRRFGALTFDRRAVHVLLFQELDTCYFCRLAVDGYGDLGFKPNGDGGARSEAPALGSAAPASGDRNMSAADRLLVATLQQRADEALDRAFLLLGLLHSQKDMAGAHRGLTHGVPGLADRALEYLDNVLEPSEKDALLPLVDETQRARRPHVAQRRFGISSVPAPAVDNPAAVDPNVPPSPGDPPPGGAPASGPKEALVRDIMHRPDGWLRACALYTQRRAPQPTRRELADLASRDPNPVVRETGATLNNGDAGHRA